MMMKKHYELIANVLNTQVDKDIIILHLAKCFKADNPRFNEYVFLAKCGLK
jgi:hypothetical protein